MDIAVIADNNVGVMAVEPITFVVASDRITIPTEDFVRTVGPQRLIRQIKQGGASTDQIILPKTTKNEVFTPVAFNVIISPCIGSLNRLGEADQITAPVDSISLQLGDRY